MLVHRLYMPEKVNTRIFEPNINWRYVKNVQDIIQGIYQVMMLTAEKTLHIQIAQTKI